MPELKITNGCEYKVGPCIKKFPKELNVPQPIQCDQKLLNKLYFAIKYLIKQLDLLKIDYFAIGGTLLGAIRHQGLIPWDLDLDVGVFKKEYFEIIKNLKKLNMIDRRYQWVDTKVPGIRIYFEEKAIVDIFVLDIYTEDNLGMYVYSGPYINGKPIYTAHKMFPKIKCSKEVLLPTKKIKFEDTLIRVPNDPIKFLELNYNKDCLTKIIPPPSFHKFFHSDYNILDYRFTSELWKLTGSKELFYNAPTFFKISESLIAKAMKKTFSNYGKIEDKSETIDLNSQLLKEIPTVMVILSKSIAKSIK